MFPWWRSALEEDEWVLVEAGSSAERQRKRQLNRGCIGNIHGAAAELCDRLGAAIRAVLTAYYTANTGDTDHTRDTSRVIELMC